MNYIEAIEYIHGTHKFGVKLGLHNIKRLLELLGNPQDELKYVHIAGTNGKGSTAAFISSILIESGYRVGIYTSPFLIRFNERIKVNNIDIDDDDLVMVISTVKEKVDYMISRNESHPTEFEIVTAAAFLYYYQKSCDVVILEVGLGGRYDSTNVIKESLLSIITPISLDHMSILGDNISKITFEKAGIIKEKSNILIYQKFEESVNVIKNTAIKKNANVYILDEKNISISSYNIGSQVFHYKQYNNLEITLLGDYQIYNASLSLEACLLLKRFGMYKICERSIRAGLTKALWQGRFEIIKKDPLFIIDGAHNVDGAKVLKSSLQRYFKENRIYFILGILEDKAYEDIISILAPIASGVFIVSGFSERALNIDKLSSVVKKYCTQVTKCDKMEAVICKAIETAQKDKDAVICAFGSLYMIGKVKQIIIEL
jgi:dihydrofolate synthase / folylpolyglutamate synthase